MTEPRPVDLSSPQKQCRRCWQTKPTSEFNKNRTRADGMQDYCRPCATAARREWVAATRESRNAYSRAYRKRNPEARRANWRRWAAKHPEQVAAHRAVAEALKRGELIRPEVCSECGGECRLHAHHDDYTRPLDVRWLCWPCHVAIHAPDWGGQRQVARP